MWLDGFVSSLFLLGLFYFGLYKSKRVLTESSYLVADRKASFFSLTATLVMTEFNTATLISFSSMGYLVGGWSLSLPCIFLIGLMFYAFSVAKKWKAYNGFSVARYFSERYGRDIGILASVALFVAMTGFSAAYVKSLALVFTPVFPQLSIWMLSGLLVGCVLLMMLRGGLFSIIRTDVFSFVIAVCVFPLMAYFAHKTSLGNEVSFVNVHQVLPLRFIVSLVVITMFTYILAPWYGQKIFAARSEKTAYFAVLCAAVLVFALYGCAVMTTWFFRKHGGVAPTPEQALPFAISSCLPPGLKGLGYGILFAASATTLSGVWSAMTGLVIGDFFKRERKENHRRSMGLTLMCALNSFVLANVLVDRVFDKLILANIPVAALAFALLGGFYWSGASRFGAYVSMVVGWGSGIFTYLYFGENGGYLWYWAMGGIPLIFISGSIVSLFFPDKKIIKVD